VGAEHLAELVKARVLSHAEGTLPADVEFPLAAAATDSVRTLDGLRAQVVVRWMDPLTFSDAVDAPRFGANADYIAYFGDGWDTNAGDPPQWHGSGSGGWVWVNHEYVSGFTPTLTSAPVGQHLAFARYLQERGVLANEVAADVWAQADIDLYLRHYKKQLGGSWMRVVQDPSTGAWEVDRGAKPVRYDATSATLSRVTWQPLSGLDQHDDTAAPLPPGVVSGIMGDCSGGQTPWGTIITAEENVQDYYGDLEACWSSAQKFLVGNGFDPGANVSPVVTPSATSELGSSSEVATRHARDFYGYLVEIDPGQPASEFDGATAPGVGHKKLGVLGRARWENAAFVVDPSWKLLENQPIVLYSADDRRGGRIFKFVSSASYVAGMSRDETRALLDEGTLYVAHFAGLDNTTGDTLVDTGLPPTEATPGSGQWIELQVDSVDVAPNAAALGDPTKTVGAALKDVTWNGIGGFPADHDVRRALFTASAKVGVMELNRPEDLEWNPKDPSGKARLYIAFTKHGQKTQLDQSGVLYDPATHAMMSPTRPDKVGSIFTLEEANPASPGASFTFSYAQAWHGSEGDSDFDAANPDNIAIDRDGGVWFGTDGNFETNHAADGLYFLDLDPAHKDGMGGIVNPSYGKAFRVVAAPSDAEATGPAFSPDMGTLFFSVQHPGENQYSSWPSGEPLSSMVAVTLRGE
jgi:secreted PhoX family phosphatase